jgi:hypothetical protein
VAVGLIAPKFILVIDRSATAIAAAKRNNETWKRQGKASFRQKALAELSGTGPFDNIFSINVNVFWTDPRAELPLLWKLLKAEPPAAVLRDKIAKLIESKLVGSGLAVKELVRKDGAAALLGVICGRDADQRKIG